MTAIEWLVQEIGKLNNGQPTEAMVMYAKKLEREQLEAADRNGASRVQYQRDHTHGGAEYWEDDNLPQTFEQHYTKIKNN